MTGPTLGTGPAAGRPWEAEQVIPLARAQELIETAFPALRPSSLVPLGEGWDNAAFVVNGSWVFRFPRRSVAVEPLRTESKLLPELSKVLPLRVPCPCFVSEGVRDYPWPFSGYPLLAGRPACVGALSNVERTRAAPVLGRFLAELHAFPAELAYARGARPDAIGRLDPGRRNAQIRERMKQALSRGWLRGGSRWDEVLTKLPASLRTGVRRVVHGDLYASHVLVTPDGRPTGVIDWGDAHLGDPAVDLSLAHAFLPPEAHASFLDAYGGCSEETWALARWRALYSSITLLIYGQDTGKAALAREAREALGFLERTAVA